MTTLEKRCEAQKAMIQIHVDYLDRWPRVTFTELAEEHGVSRGTIAKRAKMERWAYHARVIHAEKALRRSERDLAFARRQAAEVAAVLTRLSKATSTTTRDLERDSAESRAAASAASNIWSMAAWYARAVRNLEEAKAGREGGVGHSLRDLTVFEYGGPGRWPMFADDRPRKPFPWEKRAAQRAA
jgi:hypothetical protein